MKRMKRTSHGGFTIVELLIVVVVIAILAAITIVAYNGVQQQAKSSALKSEMSQLQRKIQVDLLQTKGSSVSVAQPVAYVTKVDDERPLSTPFVNAQDITIYAVFDTKSTTASSWQYIAALKPSVVGSNAFLVRTTGVGNDTIAMSYGTSSASDKSASVAGLRNTTARHICWMTAKAGENVNGCDAAAGTSRVTTAHTGWNFTSLYMPSLTDATPVAAIVFPEYQDEATRALMLDWLQKEHAG